MNRRRLRTLVARAAMGILITVALAGCGQEAEPAGSVAERGSATPPVTAPAPAGSASSKSATSPSGKPPAPASLPPGDPGLDAPAVPDPGTAPADPHEHEELRRTVPVRAMLSAADVRMTVGGRWERHAGGGDECVVPADPVATRTMSYGGTSAGIVVETVASYADADHADAAVLALREAVERCGWSDVHDPRLGSAAVAAGDGARAMTAVSVEGVLVLLVGTGKVTDGWGALVDLAVGSSCPAAPDGCH